MVVEPETGAPLLQFDAVLQLPELLVRLQVVCASAEFEKAKAPRLTLVKAIRERRIAGDFLAFMGSVGVGLTEWNSGWGIWVFAIPS